MPNVEKLLTNLLTTLFSDVEELRIWARHDEALHGLASDLPGGPASLEMVAAKVAALVQCRGLADLALFERLAQKFPRRASEIREAAGAWLRLASAAEARQAALPSDWFVQAVGFIYFVAATIRAWKSPRWLPRSAALFLVAVVSPALMRTRIGLVPLTLGLVALVVLEFGVFESPTRQA